MITSYVGRGSNNTHPDCRRNLIFHPPDHKPHRTVLRGRKCRLKCLAAGSQLSLEKRQSVALHLVEIDGEGYEDSLRQHPNNHL